MPPSDGPRLSHRLLLGASLAAMSLLPTVIGGAGVASPAFAATMYPKGTVMMLHKKQVQIAIQGYAFSPALLAVSPGTKIVWTNKDSAPHTVTGTKNAWTSATLNDGDRFARTFSKVGKFDYLCTVHPFMLGTVFVTK